MKILTEGIFKTVIDTLVLEPERYHSRNFQARRVKNQTTGISDLCTGGSLKSLNPPESTRLQRGKTPLPIYPGISFVENKKVFLFSN